MLVLRTAISVLAAILLAPAAGLAQSASVETTPVPQTPKPDFSNMQFMTGNWSCSILSSRRPAPYKTTSTASISPDGYWLITRTTIPKTSWIPADISSEDRMTYDPSTSRWVDVSYDNGGGYDLSTSPGWSGDSIVWTDVAYPKSNATATNNPTTVKKVSATKTVAHSTFTEPSGRLISVTTTCTKAGAFR